MKIVKKVAKWTALGIGAIVLTLSIVVAGLFAFTRLTDEALDPRAAKVLAANPDSRVDSAPAKSDNEINAFYVVIAGPFAGTLKEIEKRGLAAFGGDKGQSTWPEFWCKKDQLASCAQVWAAMTQDERSAVFSGSPGFASNLEDILRLRYAEDSPGARFDAPVADLRGVLALQLVSTAAVLDRLDRGNREAAIGLLRQQVSFSRRALAGATTLIGKMITVAAVERDVLFVRELAARRPQDLSESEALALLSPLTSAERSMQAPCRMETAAAVRAAMTIRPTETFEELPALLIRH